MAAISGQKKITAHGTELPLGSGRINGPLAVKALSTNTGLMYVGNAGDGTVTSSTGLVLAANEVIVFSYVGDLSSIMIDSEKDNESVAWLKLSVL